MYCKKCGNELKENAAFCNKCGNKVGESKENVSVISFDSKIVIGVIAVIVVLLISVAALFNQNKISSMQTETETEQKVTLEERVREMFYLLDRDEDELFEEVWSELLKEHEYNPELYLLCSDVAMEYGAGEVAKSFLLEGFDKTEDSEIMEEFIDISLETMDKNSAEYKVLLEFAEGLAVATDNEEQLELAKKAFMYFNMLN